MERLFLTAKGFNTSFVQFLQPYHITKVHVCSFTCMVSHVHKRTPKVVLHAQTLCTKTVIYEGKNPYLWNC